MSNNLLSRLVHDSNDENSETANGNERHWSEYLLIVMTGAFFLLATYFSWRFLDKHAGADTLIPSLGVVGIDIAFLVWLLALIYSTKSREQRWIATTMTTISFVGFAVTYLSEAAGLYIPSELTPLIVFYVVGMALLNILFIALYHATDPVNIANRKQRILNQREKRIKQHEQ